MVKSPYDLPDATRAKRIGGLEWITLIRVFAPA
jgi:hypothetical protein